MATFKELSALSNDELIERIAALVANERHSAADTISGLAELYRRKLDVDLGWSLWSYCHEELRMPESTASRYFRSARALVRYPIAADYLRDGRVSATTLSMIEKFLSPVNHRTLLDRTSGLSEKNTALLIAEINPQPDIKPSCRFVPDRTPAAAHPAAPGTSGQETSIARIETTSGLKTSSASMERSASTTSGPEVPSPGGIDEPLAHAAASAGPDVASLPALARSFSPSAEFKPLRPGHFSLRLNVDQQFRDDLESARYALSHVMPGANEAEILHECVRRTLEELSRRQRAALKAANAPAAGEETVAPASSSTSARLGEAVQSATSIPEVTPSGTSGSSSSVTSGPEVTASATAQSASATSGPEVKRIPTIDLQPLLDDSVQFVPPWLRSARPLPAAVRRAVWERDGGSCAFIGLKGHRCGSRYQLQFDHWLAYALGGEPTVANTRLLCRVHNLRLAVQTFGAERMSRYIRTDTSSPEVSAEAPEPR